MERPTFATPRVEIATEDDVAKITSPSTQMAVALGATGKHVYPGTVYGEEKRRRRAKGKVQRTARKTHRGRR